MDFWDWLVESSLSDLEQSAIEAFPTTSKRQFATQPIKITSIRWIPYVGMRTLYVRGMAQSEGREYNPVILFTDVKYHPELSPGLVEIVATDGSQHILEKLSAADTDVRVSCNCPDFKWRFRYYNFVDHSLQGPKGKKYDAEGNRPPANPTESPGLCKHLMKFSSVLHQANLL